MIGSSPAMTKLRELIRQAVSTDNTLLITGESGTGKELVAKALHYSSKRAGKPFVDVNCAAMTETLIERNSSDMRRSPLLARYQQAPREI